MAADPYRTNDQYLERELFLRANPEDVTAACYEVAASLDLAVLDKPGGKLAFAGSLPELARIDVEVAEREGGSRVSLLLELPRVGLFGWKAGVMTPYQRGLLDQVQERLGAAFAENEKQGSTADGGVGPGSARILVKPLRLSAVICALGGLFMMAGCLFMSLLTHPPAFTFVLAAIWLVLAFYSLEALRTRLLGITLRVREALIAASLVAWVVVTSLYYSM